MLDKQKLLKDLHVLKDWDKKRANEAMTTKERDDKASSAITIQSIIDLINEGTYDKN